MEKTDFNKLFLEETEEDRNMLRIAFLRNMRLNMNNFSFWFPKIRGLRSDKIVVPVSYVIDVPDEVYLSFFHERTGDEERIKRWVGNVVLPYVRKNFPDSDVFMKNGCFSNKFNFGHSCHILSTDGASEVAAKLMNLQNDAIMLKTSGYLEIVFREWIKPEEWTKTIYGGMPFRPEMRVFYDFDEKKVLYTVNYWDWDYCYDHICFDWDGEKMADAEVYESEYEKENRLVSEWGGKHLPMIAEALSTVNLRGRWSVDFILEEKRVILIDMALARQSAYWDESKIK